MLRFIRTTGLLVSFLFFSVTISGQGSSTYFVGYTKTLHGGGFQYHSPQPDITSSMLIRAVSTKEYIEWETEALPEKIQSDTVEFIWMFGIDANIDSHRFTLFFNNAPIIEFSNPLLSEKKPLVYRGDKGTSLIFRPVILDKYNDPMGYAILRVPVSIVTAGKPQVLKINGEGAGSRSWYMTFEASVREDLKIVQSDAVILKEGKPMQPVNFQFSHLGSPTDVTLSIAGVSSKKIRVEAGYSTTEVLIPLAEKETSYVAEILSDNAVPKKYSFSVVPPHHYTIYLVQHAHTDIGYTRPQTEILPEHLRFIDYALDYCDNTDSYPDDARFRWTCETSWPVREYLTSRPQYQVDRLKRRIKEGRIEVTGLFLNMSDLYDENILRASLEPIGMFRKEGIQVRTAMQDDVNGAPWALVDDLTNLGIRYFTMGQNTHRAHKPFDKPTAFWWESPSGKRLLTFRGEHYMHGNFLGILTDDISAFEKNLFKYIYDLQNLKYTYEDICIQFSGYLTDNSPPSTTACDLIRKWNEKYQWPRLRLATAGEFPEKIEAQYGPGLQVIKGAWPDWWSDGFGSTAIETATARKSQTDFIANLGLLAMCRMAGYKIPGLAAELIKDIKDDLAFWDEHTFTAAESITEPLAENTYVQWGQKAANVWDAVKKNSLLRETAFGVIQDRPGKENVPSIVIFNPLNRERSGIATCYIDHQIIPNNKAFVVADEKGNKINAIALNSRDDGTYWAFYGDKIPAFGYKAYRIEVSDKVQPTSREEDFRGVLENAYYRIVFDTVRGGIKSLYDKTCGKELADANAPWLMGQFVYERLGKNRNQLELKRLDEVSRTGLKNLTFSKIKYGGIWQSIVMNGKSPECADADGIRIEFRLFEVEKRLDVVCSMKKLPVTDPEAAYIAFPFAMEKARIHYDVPGGDVIAGKDQIDGSSADWCGVQNYAAVKTNDFQVVLTSPEIPLMQFGDLNLGKFMRMTQIEKPYIYSWVLNNYWTTNFLASQQGELKWTYHITSSADTSNQFRNFFGWGCRIPFPARVIPSCDKPYGQKEESFMPGTLRNLLLITAEPSDNPANVNFMVREVNGKSDKLNTSGEQVVVIGPFETKRIVIKP